MKENGGTDNGRNEKRKIYETGRSENEQCVETDRVAWESGEYQRL